MAKLLFFIHGMGHHPDEHEEGWHEKPLQVLREAAARYGVADRFDDRVQPHAITYDGVFRDTLEEIGTSVGELREAMERNAVDGLEIVRWLDDQDITATERKFFWSHVVDVLLYRFFPQVAAEVRTRVMHRFVEVVNAAEDAPGPRPDVAIVAHSLGTSVIHDALADLAARPLRGSGAYLSSRGWRLDHLFMLANVSRVLSRLGTGFYRSPVRCVSAPAVDGAAACVERYFDFRHRLDPIPAVKAFSPEGWGEHFQAVTSLDHVLEWNVHGYEHYLRHPDVHVPILNELLGYRIGEEQRRAAVAELDAAPRPDLIEQADRLRTELRRVRDRVGSVPTADGAAALVLVKAATETLALIEETRAACEEAIR